MTRLINNMEKQNLVKRTNSEEDKRINRIYLTAYGKSLEDKSRYIANKTLKEALRGLSIEELRISQDVLRKVFSNTKD